MTPTIEKLDPDGREEVLARGFPMEAQGGKLFDVRLAGDGIERETFSQHWRRCEGCIQCWPESLERESDI